MRTKFLKSLFSVLVIVVSGVLVKQFCYKKTDGFALYKILSPLSFNPEWEPSSPAVNELSEILDQPFYYLAKGAQSYVFASKDGQTVIKFFRVYHLLPPVWLRALAMPLFLQPYKVCKMIDKRIELGKDFLSYKIAFDEMKEETGLIYLHLNKTSHLNKRVTIYDKIGIAYELDMDKMEFLVQKRATLVYPAIDLLMKTERPDAAKEAIGKLVQLLIARCEKRIFDKDPDLNTNFGFLDGGKKRLRKLISEGSAMSPNVKTPQLIAMRSSGLRTIFDSGLKSQRYPALSEHLASEIQKINL